jgi:hypothetical protein
MNIEDLKCCGNCIYLFEQPVEIIKRSANFFIYPKYHEIWCQHEKPSIKKYCDKWENDTYKQSTRRYK